MKGTKQLLACSIGLFATVTFSQLAFADLTYPTANTSTRVGGTVAAGCTGSYNYCSVSCGTGVGPSGGYCSYPNVGSFTLTGTVTSNYGSHSHAVTVTVNPVTYLNPGAQWLDGPYDYSEYQFYAADVTGDGRADMVGILPREERVVVWKANSTGTGFEGGVEWLNGPYNYNGYVFQAADVTGDGRADIVGISAGEERVVVWTTNTDGTQGTRSLGGVEWLNGPYNYNGYGFYVADVTGDKRADIVGIAAGEERVVVWTTNTDGTQGTRSLNAVDLSRPHPF